MAVFASPYGGEMPFEVSRCFSIINEVGTIPFYPNKIMTSDQILHLICHTEQKTDVMVRMVQC